MRKIKWVNHKILTSSIVFAWTGDFLFTTVAAMGTIFPDAIEGKAKINSEIWKKRHRKNSHCLSTYVFSLFLIISLIVGRLIFCDDDVLYMKIYMIMYWFIIGAILHILQDSLCGQVPLYGKVWFGHKWFEIGSIKEYVFTYSISGICIIIYLNG